MTLQPFSIGPIVASPGTTAKGLLPVAFRADGSTIGIPLVILHGLRPGPVCCVDAGTHGDEHEGAHALLRLIQTLEPTQIRGTLVAIMALNVPANDALQRGNPFDHWATDLNRLFPGTDRGNLSQRIANAYIEQVTAPATFVISIHSGASYIHWSPIVMCGADDPSVDLAKALGPAWDVIGESEGISGSAQDALTKRGIPAVAIEVGGAAERLLDTFNRNVELAAGAILNAMAHFQMIDGQPARAASWTVVRNRAVRSSFAGLIRPVEHFPLRRFVEHGTVLMRIYNLLGDELEEVSAPFDGLVMGVRTYPYAPPGWPLIWMSEIVHTVRE